MRAIVVSDTHGYYANLHEILKALGEYDVLIHLGDGYSDLRFIKPYINADIVCVGGNNDFSSDNLRKEVIIELFGEKIFCTHGHRYGVRQGRETLSKVALANGCKYALYGHTHEVMDEMIGEVRCMNPGSIGYPLNGRALIEITDNNEKIHFNFIKL
ncbi:MAG: metallophosphoesterase [Clostridia bacterium]|nr:metallophosphoesterase [Clostridia bacterium]